MAVSAGWGRAAGCLNASYKKGQREIRDLRRDLFSSELRESWDSADLESDPKWSRLSEPDAQITVMLTYLRNQTHQRPHRATALRESAKPSSRTRWDAHLAAIWSRTWRYAERGCFLPDFCKSPHRSPRSPSWWLSRNRHLRRQRKVIRTQVLREEPTFLPRIHFWSQVTFIDL